MLGLRTIIEIGLINRNVVPSLKKNVDPGTFNLVKSSL